VKAGLHCWLPARPSLIPIAKAAARRSRNPRMPAFPPQVKWNARIISLFSEHRRRCPSSSLPSVPGHSRGLTLNPFMSSEMQSFCHRRTLTDWRPLERIARQNPCRGSSRARESLTISSISAERELRRMRNVPAQIYSHHVEYAGSDQLVARAGRCASHKDIRGVQESGVWNNQGVRR